MQMVSLDNAIVARFARGGEHFEVLADPENALRLREGGDIDLDAVLAIEEIFKDASKGEKASDESLKHAFSTHRSNSHCKTDHHRR